MNITLIVGLPCSGKTMYANSKKLEHSLVIDDPKDFQRDIVKPVSEYRITTGHRITEIIITDPWLCVPGIRTMCIQKLQDDFGPESIINVQYFENDPDKCLQNMEIRILNGDTRKVENFIRDITKHYIIPTGTTTVPIFQPTAILNQGDNIHVK